MKTPAKIYSMRNMVRLFDTPELLNWVTTQQELLNALYFAYTNDDAEPHILHYNEAIFSTFAHFTADIYRADQYISYDNLLQLASLNCANASLDSDMELHVQLSYDQHINGCHIVVALNLYHRLPGDDVALLEAMGKITHEMKPAATQTTVHC